MIRTMNGKPRTMTSMKSISAALDDAIASLTTLDGERLEEIERQVSAAVEANRVPLWLSGSHTQEEREEELREVVARHRLLGNLLDTTNLNVTVLQGLHRRNRTGGEPWGR